HADGAAVERRIRLRRSVPPGAVGRVLRAGLRERRDRAHQARPRGVPHRRARTRHPARTDGVHRQQGGQRRRRRRARRRRPRVHRSRVTSLVPGGARMTRLFSPIRLRGLELPNRLWLSPMCQYSVEREDGVPTDWHLAHLGSFARAGWGLLLTEATGVTADGRISPQDTGIWNDEQTAAWRRVVDFVHAQGAAIGMQLAHAGRKAATYRPWAPERGTVPPTEGGWPTVAPSAVPFGWFAPPRELATAELPDVVTAF